MLKPAEACKDQEYAYEKDGMRYCVPCPSGCLNCSYNQLTLSINCLNCTAGYRYDSVNRNCPLSCPEGYYYYAVDKTCKQCVTNCLRCNGSEVDNCQVYQQSTTTPPTPTKPLDCGVSAYPNSDNSNCLCMEQSKIYNPLEKTCSHAQDLISANVNCTVKQIYNPYKQACTFCDANKLCKICMYESTSA